MISWTVSCTLILKRPYLLILSMCPVFVIAQDKKISFKANDILITKLLDTVQEQTGKRFHYWDSCFGKSETVDADFKDATLDEFLQKVLRVRGITWDIRPDKILLHCKVAADKRPVTTDSLVYGIVKDEKGNPLPQATIKVLNTERGALSDARGRFKILVPARREYLLVTSVGFEQAIVPVARNIIINMRKHIDELDEILVTSYGTTTRRFNTGSIEVVKSTPLHSYEATDALLGLAGKVPGLAIRQTSGLPGSRLQVNIRGINSLNSGTAPLYIIDGLPVAPEVYNGFGPIMEKVSSMIFRNEADFEQIEILKDADATAIYGSRGANGVILITTKRGKAGPLSVEAKVSRGIATVSRHIDLMDNKQYLALRREAFANDNLTAQPGNAPDLFKWDTTRTTDWQKALTGGTAHMTDAQVAISGGNKQVQYLFSNYYHRNTTVYPGKFSVSSAGAHFYIHTDTIGKHFSINLTGSSSLTRTVLPGRDPAGDILLPPVYPALTLPRGGLNYKSDPAVLLKIGPVYEGNAMNTSLSMLTTCRVYEGLSLSLNTGYNELSVDGITISPIAMQPPAMRDNATGSATAAYYTTQSLIFEPRLNYTRNRWTVILGGTYHLAKDITETIEGCGYRSDRDIRDIAAAPQQKAQYNEQSYKYLAAFVRTQYNYERQFLLNFTIRTDGSSRFSPSKRLSGWGAIGAGWVFSENKSIKAFMPFLQYGKLRASYGLVGNDQIGNGKFNETYQPGNGSYMGKDVLIPATPANRNYTWESTRKFDAGLEMRFLKKSRLLFSVNYYNNYSYDQLIKVSLPNTAGVGTVLSNQPASLRNTGWEIICRGGLIMTRRVAWNAAFNISFEKNRLLSYPGLKDKSQLGKPVPSVKLYKQEGIDAATGIPRFSTERTAWKHNLPWCYGGLQSKFSWKEFQFEAQFKFFLQEGIHDVRAAAAMPGVMRNQPVEVTDRWRKPGDNAAFQKASMAADMQAIYEMKLKQSDYLYANSSFIRCSVLSVSWQLPANCTRWMRMKDGNIHFMATNPFIITGYPGMDPEVQSLSTIPPLRGFTMGLQLSL